MPRSLEKPANGSLNVRNKCLWHVNSTHRRFTGGAFCQTIIMSWLRLAGLNHSSDLWDSFMDDLRSAGILRMKEEGDRFGFGVLTAKYDRSTAFRRNVRSTAFRRNVRSTAFRRNDFLINRIPPKGGTPNCYSKLTSASSRSHRNSLAKLQKVFPVGFPRLRPCRPCRRPCRR